MDTILYAVLGFSTGLFVGFRFTRLQKQINDLRARLTELDTTPAPGVAMGAYDKVDEYNGVNTDSAIGIVEVKTPQLLDWEERQRQQKDIENV